MPRNRKVWPYEFRCFGCGAEYTRPEALKKKYVTKETMPSWTERSRGSLHRAPSEIVHPASSTTSTHGYKCWDCGTLLTHLPISSDGRALRVSQFVFHHLFGVGEVTEIKKGVLERKSEVWADKHVFEVGESSFVVESIKGSRLVDHEFEFQRANEFTIIEPRLHSEMEHRNRLLDQKERQIRQGSLNELSLVTLGLDVGDTIEHLSFGEGVIVGFVAAGLKSKVVVRFSAADEKEFEIATAPICRSQFFVGEIVNADLIGDCTILAFDEGEDGSYVLVKCAGDRVERLSTRTAKLRKVGNGASTISGRSSRPAEPSNAQNIGLKVGDTVEHAVFGEGIIIDLTGSGDKTEAVINFRDRGRKHLLLAWAPLKKV